MRCFAADDSIADPKVQADLIAAIAADEVGESTWLEWKSTVDFEAGSDLGFIAKAMVAMANRAPGTSEPFSGKGIVVIGATVGSVPGVERLDPAVLSDKLDPYIGEDLKHDRFWRELNGKWVLIIAVAAPMPGDRIHTIHKEFPTAEPKWTTPTARDGTIYVRRSGKSHPARSAEVGALMDRLTATRLSLDVTVPDGQISCFTVDREINQLAEQIVEAERCRLLRPIAQWPRGGMREFSARCTPDQYRAEVEDYCSRLGPRIVRYFDALAGRFSSIFALEVTNLTDRNFTAVEIVLELPAAVRAARQLSWEDMPDFEDLFAGRPLDYRASKEAVMDAAFANVSTAVGSMTSGEVIPGPTISHDGDRTRITFEPFDLRPRRPGNRRRDVNHDVVLFAYAPLPEMVECHWYATATSTNGLAEGTVAIATVTNENDLAAEARHWSSEQPYRHER